MDLKEKAALTSLAVNLVLAIFKLVFAFFSNASLLLLDAIHSIMDSVSAFLAYISIRISRHEAYEQNGIIRQLENIASIIISFIIFFGAYEVFRRAFNPTLLVPGSIPNYPLAILGVLISMVVCYVISKYEVGVGLKTKSNVLVSDGYEWRMDLYSSSMVLISFIGSMVGIQLNKIAGLIIALSIFKLGIEVFLRGGTALLNGFQEDLGDEHRSKLTPSFDLDRLIRRSKKLTGYILALIILTYLFSGVFTVESDEQALIKRFGVYSGVRVGPGLHYHLPWPFESAIKAKVTKVFRVEMGFRQSQEPFAGLEAELWESGHGERGYSKNLEESLMISGDENIVDINAVVQYKINDLELFLFNTREPHRILRDSLESSIRQVIGTKSIDDALTVGKSMIQDDVKENTQKILDEYPSGLEILSIQLQDVHPPTEVAESFRDVASAREDKNKIINDARAYENDILPKSRGEAHKLILDSEAYAINRIRLSRGESQRFLELYHSYLKNENLTRTRLYLETMEQILPNARIYVIDSKDAGNEQAYYSRLLPLMDLKNQKPTPVTEANQQAVSEDTLYEQYVELTDEDLKRYMEDFSPTFL